MGKNKRNQIDIECSLGKFKVDSNEEVGFLHWCEDLVKQNLIEINLECFYQPPAYELLPPVKILDGKKEKTLLREHNYTLDFIIKIKPELFNIFPKLSKYLINSFDNYCYIDIKGMFNKNGGDRSFAINQKLLYNKYQIFVNKVIPDKLYEYSFLPSLERYSPKKKQLREKYKHLLTLEEILK